MLRLFVWLASTFWNLHGTHHLPRTQEVCCAFVAKSSDIQRICTIATKLLYGTRPPVQALLVPLLQSCDWMKDKQQVAENSCKRSLELHEVNTGWRHGPVVITVPDVRLLRPACSRNHSDSISNNELSNKIAIEGKRKSNHTEERVSRRTSWYCWTRCWD